MDKQIIAAPIPVGTLPAPGVVQNEQHIHVGKDASTDIKTLIPRHLLKIERNDKYVVGRKESLPLETIRLISYMMNRLDQFHTYDISFRGMTSHAALEFGLSPPHFANARSPSVIVYLPVVSSDQL